MRLVRPPGLRLGSLAAGIWPRTAQKRRFFGTFGRETASRRRRRATRPGPQLPAVASMRGWTVGSGWWAAQARCARGSGGADGNGCGYLIQFERVIFSIGACHPHPAPVAPTPEPAAAAPPNRAPRSIGVPGDALAPLGRPEAAARPRRRLPRGARPPRNGYILENASQPAPQPARRGRRAAQGRRTCPLRLPWGGRGRAAARGQYNRPRVGPSGAGF